MYNYVLTVIWVLRHLQLMCNNIHVISYSLVINSSGLIMWSVHKRVIRVS